MTEKHPDRTAIPVPKADAPWWPDVNEFALTFNAYERVGDFDTVAEMGNAAAKAFAEDGSLPRDVAGLRTCLFFEQRRYRHLDVEPYKNPEFRSYLTALPARIRELTGGTVPGPPDPLP